MKKSKVDLSELSKYIEKYSKEVLRITVGDIRDELTDMAQTAIIKFYTSYSPKYYDRHYYNFMENSFKKYYSNPHNTIYRGGVELTPEALDDIYQDSPIEVFDTVYAGFHGPASMIGMGYAENLGVTPQFYNKKYAKYAYSPDRMSPSPMQMILDKRDEIVDDIQNYIKKAQSKINL